MPDAGSKNGLGSMEPVGWQMSPPPELSVNWGLEGDNVVPPTATEMQSWPVSLWLGDWAAS